LFAFSGRYLWRDDFEMWLGFELRIRFEKKIKEIRD